MIKYIIDKIGIDKSIAYTSSSRIVQAFGSIITALLIVSFLTKEEMGFYYTFGSVLALQIFFELGLNGILTQYVAHEMAHLSWDGTNVVGDDMYKSRLSSLIHFSMKWYCILSVFLFLGLSIAGTYFFTTYDKTNGGVSWKIPWLLMCALTAVNLILSPIFCILEGLGKVKEVAKYRFLQQLFGYAIIWPSFILNARLMTMPINSLTWILVSFAYLYFTDFGKILRNIWRVNIKEKVSYRYEIFPLQWKIALSWVSGYFIFQLFNPVLFATDGAVVAGQMGMTLQALNAISALAVSWSSTKIPKYSTLIELKQYKELDNLFFRTTKQAGFVEAVLMIMFFCIILLIRYYHIVFFDKVYLGDRFLDYIPLILMIIPMYLQQYINAWAIYLRCHKQEPYLWLSVISGIYMLLGTMLIGKFWGVVGISGNYCIEQIIGMVFAYYIFVIKRREWHGAE